MDPCTRGFGFAVMEGLEFLVDWGMKEARGDKNAACLESLDALLQVYRPDRLVMESCVAEGTRRCKRVKDLMLEMFKLALRHGIIGAPIPPSAVRDTFEEWKAHNKHEIATVIGNLYPELIPRMPPERKCWMNEDPRMHIFDAMALGITYFHNKNWRLKWH